MSDLPSEGLSVTGTIKCMIVGDSQTGKTSLFRRLLKRSPAMEYIPTVFEVVTEEICTESEGKVNLTLWDSGGSHTFDSIRPISYAHTDCFMICYSINDTISYENVEKRWVPEIMTHGDGPGVPIVLVVTDGLSSNKEPSVREEDVLLTGKNLMNKVGAKAVFHFSIKNHHDKNAAILEKVIQLACLKKIAEEKPPDPIWNFQSVNVLVIGDAKVGKTSLIQACIQNQSQVPLNPAKHNHNRFEEYYHDTIIKGCEYFLRFIELRLDEQCHDQEHHLKACGQIDVFLYCYAINDPFSFKSIEEFGSERNRKLCKSLPTFLIGTKSDLKEVSDIVIPPVDGKQLMLELQCSAFIECSTKSLDNISQIFSTILNPLNETERIATEKADEEEK